MLLATQGIFMLNERFHKEVERIIMGNQLGPRMAIFSWLIYKRKFLPKSLMHNFYLSFIFDILMMCTQFSIATKIATSFFRFWTHSIIAWNLQCKKPQIHLLF